MILWAFVTVLCVARAAHSRIDQPDKVLAVELGSTVTLRCISWKENIFWYKQVAGQRPRVISAFQKLMEPIFYKEFKNERFWGIRLRSSTNLTISDIIQSDEAVYYCASRAFYIEFGSGTHLKIKGHQAAAFETSNFNKTCQQKCNKNSTTEKSNVSDERLYPAVLGLACALGLCGVRSSRQDNQIREQWNAQDPDDENVTYVAYTCDSLRKTFNLEENLSRECI
ncbi:novel immune-type receptor 14a precursor [Danio rerio]|uniref:Novel immune-type receptor 14a long isoform n=1 Tax=Danio rerio TaxID=7955 RepID=B2XU08_DANRE|nr:novel immune-type receptor 14a precursor [Danio rerio]ABY25989.1 novel immune-type receptor 14a long isoform [Danio rerio]|eukprot:NP_001124085.1 novel immune-type receptor 14a precursor [Danio rerio]